MNALSKYLQENNLTDSEFARIAKLKQPTVWRIKNNKVKQVSPDSARLIEKATGGSVTAMELLFPRQRIKNKGQGETAAVSK
jgi:transcriptional regulator with XRE-family HTH domain